MRNHVEYRLTCLRYIVAGQGVNSVTDNGNIWIGSDGPNKFTFINNATTPYSAPVTLIIWDFPTGDYEASFMNVRAPKISYSLPNAGDSVTISMANDVSGGWSQLTDHMTYLSQYGQIFNTWGEFTTGGWATFDITRLVNMGGNVMSAQVLEDGCISNMDTCSFHCKNDLTSCGDSGTYELLDCAAGSQTGASYGSWDNINPEGGCQGWSNGGSIEVLLGNY